MIVLIPMAGEGARFKEAGYPEPKPLIPIAGQPMILKALEALPKGDKYIFVCLKEHIENYAIDKIIKEKYPNSEFISIDAITEGQASTCLLAKNFINNEEELLIAACDNAMTWNSSQFDKLRADHTIDAIAWTFRNNATVKKNPTAYGWVKIDANGKIENISCKIPISNTPQNDHAIVGTFWFKKGSDFVQAAEQMIINNKRINNEFYVDTVFNEFDEFGLVAKIFEVNKYICFGTPNDLKTYEYWNNFFNSSLSAHSRSRETRSPPLEGIAFR